MMKLADGQTFALCDIKHDVYCLVEVRVSSFQNIPDVFDSDGLCAHFSTVAFNSSKIYKIYRRL